MAMAASVQTRAVARSGYPSALADSVTALVLYEAAVRRTCQMSRAPR